MTTQRPPFSAARGLAAIGGFVAFGVTLSGVYSTTGFGLPCPFRLLTGWLCPFCGGTRLGSALLHGELGAAFAHNPMVFVGLVALAALGVVWTVEALGGPRVRPPAALTARLRSVRRLSWVVGAVAVAAAYVLVRNLS